MAKSNMAFFLRTNRKECHPYQGYLGELENTLEAEQLFVNYGEPGGKIETVNLSENLVLICNREGRRLGYPSNRALFDKDGAIREIFFGDILVVRCEGDEFTSITPEDLAFVEKCLRPVKIYFNEFLIQLPLDLLPKYEEGEMDG